MEHGRGEHGWRSAATLGAGLNAEKALAESTRVKTAEFEREMEAYIKVAKQLLLPPPLQQQQQKQQRLPLGASVDREPSMLAAAVAAPHRVTPGKTRLQASEENKENVGNYSSSNKTFQAEERQKQQRRRLERTSSVRAAREERLAASDEIRVLQQRKADAEVRLQGEKLSNLEQGLELGVLRLERLLDRERILELLRLTDPDRPVAAERPVGAAIAVGDNIVAGDGRGEVSKELIEELERRVGEAEERVRKEATKLGTEVAGRLEERAERERGVRREEVSSRDEIARLQTALKLKEGRLAHTVLDYLELRHAMLRAQRTASETQEDTSTVVRAHEEEIRMCRERTARQSRSIEEQIAKTCDDVEAELRRQIQLREDEACMLEEQRAETEELYEARAVRLEKLFKEWKAKHVALRRRFLLETEGFRRDADNIGRRFERIRGGPPGGRPAISSRSGSSARHAVERAIYS